MNVAVLLCALFAAVAVLAAQEEKKPYPIFTIEHFTAAMKTTGQAFNAVNATLSTGPTAAKDPGDAKAYVAISRDRLATTITFWRDRKRDDAIKMLRDVLNKMDALDDALSADVIDQPKVSAIAREIGTGCQACHQIYREQDPITKAYRVKAAAGR
jgi:cytochrome c556